MTAVYTIPDSEQDAQSWYEAVNTVANDLETLIPPYYRNRTFAGILGDIKALPPRKALSLISRKKGLGLQYAREYLTTGIDNGLGYQACTLDAFHAVSNDRFYGIMRSPVLDVGCAVGVTAGVLGLDKTWGFDLFADLLRTARLVDTLTGRNHTYTVADMTQPWPFAQVFETVFCGLVCHHLKRQGDVMTFFSQASGALRQGGHLIITLPSGSMDTITHCRNIINAVEGFGFTHDPQLTGVIMSTDSPHSLYWSFLMVFVKTGNHTPETFISPQFGFHLYRTPVSRIEKGEKARSTATATRKIRHTRFRLVSLGQAHSMWSDRPLVYDTLNCMSQ